MMLGRDDWTEAIRQIPRRNRYVRTDNDRCPPTAWRGLPWQATMDKELAGMPEALGYFVATSCRRFSAAALRPARPRRGGPADAGCAFFNSLGIALRASASLAAAR